MNWNNEFGFGQVVDATGASASVIKSWLHKGVVVGYRKISGGRPEGKRRGYKLHTVLELAIAKAILDNGPSDLASAFHAANHFAHGGDEHRPPGVPFQTGFTYLVVSGNHYEVFNHIPGKDFMPDLRFVSRGREGMVLIDINAVFDRVTSALGIHPQEAIDVMYGNT